MRVKQIRKKHYIHEVALGLDKFINALTLGSHRETISSRMGRALSRDNSNCKICHLLCKLLNLIDKNHCKDAVDERFLNGTSTNKKSGMSN